MTFEHPLATLVGRLLQEEDNVTTASPTFAPTVSPVDDSSGGSPSRGAYEFVAFILWYLFLVLCCIVPTCCAYRRRRMLEAQYHHHQQTFTLEQLQQLSQAQQQLHNSNGGGLLFLPYRQSLLAMAQDNNNTLIDSEAAKEERTRRIEESLKETTFVVKQEDIVEGEASMALKKEEVDKSTSAGDGADDKDDENENEQPSSPAPATTNLQDMEALALADLEVTSVLRLPSRDIEDGSHAEVPGICAICLCGYEAGDSVTYSKQPECQHAFHQECIVPWLAKTNDGEPKCPCCRQVYCHIQPITLTDLANINNNNNNNSRGMNNDDAENTSTQRSAVPRTLSALEFMMAVRSGGSSLFVPQEFQVHSAARNNRAGNDNDDNANGQNDQNNDIEEGNRNGRTDDGMESEEERREGNRDVIDA